MPDSTRDIFQQKTVDELLFFTRNPSFYAPELVAAAAQELRRRGAAAAPAAPAPAAPAPAAPAPAAPAPAGAAVASAPERPEPARAPRRRGLWIAAGVWVLLGAGWLLARHYPGSNPLASIGAAAAPVTHTDSIVAATSPAPDTSLTLTTAHSSPLPNYDGTVSACIAQQLSRVPAGEKKALPEFRQYRELTRRFWAAQTLTEHIVAKYRSEPQNPVLPGQLEIVQAAWGDWNRAAVYSFAFGPIMADHLDRMRRVGQQEKEQLSELSATLSTGQPADADRAALRKTDVQDLLSGLLPASPVSHQPYRKMVRRVHL